MRVLVTGASGFLGGHVCARLVAGGHEVRALVRPTSDVGVLAELGVARVTGDVADRPSLDAAVDGVDAIVHAAGVVKVRALSDFERVNVRGTENMLDALEATGARPKRFVYVSSLAVRGPSDGPWPRPDDLPPDPRTTYGRTKADAEALVLAEKDVFPVTSIRPPTIYGPRDREILPLFRLASRRLRLEFRPDGAVSFVHVEDCAAAIAALLESPHPSGRIYSVDDGAAHTMSDIGRALEAAVGRRALRIPIPRALIPPAALVSELFARVRGKAAMLTRDKAPEIAARFWVSGHEAITRDIGWRPAIPLEEGFRRTAAWYRENGWM